MKKTGKFLSCNCKKRPKTEVLSAIGVGVAAVGAAAAYFSTELLVKTALDREEPKIMKRASKRASGNKLGVEVENMCRTASENLRNAEHENVEIVAADGTKLVGHLFECENPERLIVAFHGWRSSWSYDYGLVSDFWHNNGCTVLYVEQRGQNNSGGDYMGFGLTERFDCVDWVNWAADRFGENIPIYLAGVSMGAATVLMASDLEYPKNLKGIMADCGFTSPKAICKYVANKNLHIPYSTKSLLVDKMFKKRIMQGAEGYSTLKALKNTEIPVLFVHGTDDSFVPIEMTYQNYKACNSEKRLLVVPGAEHALSYLVDKKLYEKTVLEFWKDFDSRD